MTEYEQDQIDLVRAKRFATGRPVARQQPSVDGARWRSFVDERPVRAELLPAPEGFRTRREALNMAKAVQEAARIMVRIIEARYQTSAPNPAS